MKKICRGSCHQEKPLDDFYRDPTHTDGRKHVCKACTREQNRVETQWIVKYGIPEEFKRWSRLAT